MAYGERIEATRRNLSRFPHRRKRQPDLGRGVRVLHLDRRVTILYRVGEDTVLVEGIAWGGRDIGATHIED